jgi:phytoene desaturase
MRPPKIAIVGAGPGGLAAAVLLAGKGLDVTVYEAQPEIGGRTGRITKGQYAFDRGPTFFLMPYVLQEIFAAVGKDLNDYADLRRLDPMYRLLIGQPDGSDATIDATQDLGRMAAQLSALHPDDGRAFESFVAHNRKKLNAAEPILRRPIRSLADLIRTDAMRVLPVLKPTQTVDSLSSRYFKHPASKIAVGFQSKYLGMSPYECPSLFTILPFIEYEYGVWHPIGGCHALMQAMAKVFVELGGTIRTGAPVRSVRVERGRVTGLEIHGEFEPCDHAVINADATWALKNLFPESIRGKTTDASLDGKKYSCSTFMLYLGVEGEVDLPHHTIRTAPNYRGNLLDIGGEDGAAGRLTEDPSFYVCNPSVTDPSLAPEGHSSLYVLMPTPNTRAAIDWKAQAPVCRERLLERIRTVLGVDLKGRIQAEVMLTPDDWAAQNINFGATFNLAHSLDQMLHKRPQHRVPFADGAWLVGGGTHPGSGLPVIFLSAQITAGLVLKELGIEPRAVAPQRAEPQLAGAAL